MLEKILWESLDCKEIKPVHSKGNQSWILIGRTGAEAETPILWPLNMNNWLIGKAPDAGEDWRWEEKGTAKDEMVGWHHQLFGYESGWALRVGDRQGSQAFCSPLGCQELDMTERLNWLTDSHYGEHYVSSLKTLKIEVAYVPASPLMGIYLEKNIIWKDTCNPVFIAALFTIAKTWKQPKCPKTEEYIKKMWYIYTHTHTHTHIYPGILLSH